MFKSRWIGPLILLTGGAAYSLLEWQIDDWNRDFTATSAATEYGAADTELQPVAMADSVEQAERAVLNATLSLQGWEYDQGVDEMGARKLRFTRTCPYLRVIDDVTVTIVSRDDEVVISASSESRSPWGDLGRNPRNLKQLMRKVREILWVE
jgi:uncharacterized protein (DUF1499 family)